MSSETRCACEVPEVEAQLIRANIERCGRCKRPLAVPPSDAGTETPMTHDERMNAVQEYIARVRRIEEENKQLWEVIRQRERDAYAVANGLDVAELDAHNAELAMENARLRARSPDDALREALSLFVRPDNGYCSACGGRWLYDLKGKPEPHGEHRPECPALLLYPTSAVLSPTAPPPSTEPER